MKPQNVVEGYEILQEYPPELLELRKHVEQAAHQYWDGKAPPWVSRDKDWRDVPYPVSGDVQAAYIATADPITVHGLYQYSDRLMRYQQELVKDLQDANESARLWYQRYQKIPAWIRWLFEW